MDGSCEVCSRLRDFCQCGAYPSVKAPEDALHKICDSLPPWMKCMPGEEGPLLRRALSDAQAEIARLRGALEGIADTKAWPFAIAGDLRMLAAKALQSNPTDHRPA